MTQINANESYDGSFTFRILCQVRYETCSSPLYKQCPGQKIEVDKLPEGRVVVKAGRQDGAISNFVGCLSQQATRPLTIDEINEVAAQGWTEEN